MSKHKIAEWAGVLVTASLAVKTDGTPWTAADGTEYDPPAQHLFLEVPPTSHS
jgi:hypothetical protein